MLCISNGILLVFGLFGRAGLVIIAVLEEPDLTLELVALYEKNEVRDLLRSQDFPHLTKGVVQELPFLLNLPPELDKVLRRFLEMAAMFRDLLAFLFQLVPEPWGLDHRSGHSLNLVPPVVLVLVEGVAENADLFDC